MSRDYVPLDEKPERRIGLRTLGIVGIVAFLIGAIAIGYAIKNYGHWFEGQPTPAKTRASAMQPAVPDDDAIAAPSAISTDRSEEHTSELQSLMRNSYALFCLKKKKKVNIKKIVENNKMMKKNPHWNTPTSKLNNTRNNMTKKYNT